MTVNDGRATDGQPLAVWSGPVCVPVLSDDAASSDPQTAPSREAREVWRAATLARMLWTRATALYAPMRRPLGLALRVLVSASVLIVLVMRANVSALAHVLGRMDALLALAALGVGIITVVVSAEQWRQLLKSEHIRLSLAMATGIYFLGITFNQLLPSSIGGDVVKAAYVARLSGRGMGTASATLMARLLGLIGLLATALPVSIAASLGMPHYSWELTIVLLAIAVAYALGLALLMRGPDLMRFIGLDHLRRFRIGAMLRDLAEALAQYRRRWRVCVITVVYSVLFYAASYLNYFLYGQALGLHTPFWFYWVAIPLSSLATMAPISLNGYGVRGASLAVLFSMMGETTASALALAVAMELQLLLFAVIGGGVIIALKRTGITVLQTPNQVTSEAAEALPREAHTAFAAVPQQAQLRINAQASWKRALIRVRGTRSMQHVTQEEAPVAPIVAAKPEPTTRVVPVLQAQAEAQTMLEPASDPAGQTVEPLLIASSAPRAATLQRAWKRMPPLKSRRGAVVGAVSLVALVAIVWTLAAHLATPPKVTIYTVRSQDLTTYVGGGGVTAAVQELTIAYPVSAQVTKVDVQVGQMVKPGQPLLSLDSAGLAAQLEQAYNQWQIAQNYVAALRFSGATSSQLAAATQQAATAKSHYDTLNNEINSPTFNNGNLTSTFSGIVASINTAPGALFSANTKLMTIEDISTIIVRAQFPLEYRAQVTIGAPADVTSAAVNAQSFTGTVSAILPALSVPGSDTFNAWITVPNKAMQLFANEGVYVRVRGQQTLPAIPQLAINNASGDATVFRYANGKAHLVHVAVGARDGDMFGITDGLRPGDLVIIVGQYRLSDGEAVMVNKTE